MLVEAGWIEGATAADLADAYRYLRWIEHRLQMVADEQTQEVPSDPAPLESFARFAGYASTDDFADALRSVLSRVQRHYAGLFEDAPELTSEGENLVFAGEKDDPGTVAALIAHGLSATGRRSGVRARLAPRTLSGHALARARELLTEVQPLLIKALAGTTDPDRAIATFDTFLAELPAGVQLFSLLKANPALMRLVADIMGTAPRLSRILSRRRRLLDAVIDPRAFGALPSAEDMHAPVSSEMAQAVDPQDVLDRARVVGSEQSFLIGVRVLSGSINASEAGIAYARLAESLIAALAADVETEMERAHGRVPGGGAVVLAMGKLGGWEMTASSDLDLIVVYDYDPTATQSDGAKPLAPSQYYARYTQRLISHLSAPTAEGALYDVDMRLRPSGQKGPVAAQLYVPRLSGQRGLDLGASGADPRPRHLRPAGIAPRAWRRPSGTPSRVRATPRLIAKDVRDMRARIEGERGRTISGT